MNGAFLFSARPPPVQYTRKITNAKSSATHASAKIGSITAGALFISYLVLSVRAA